MSCVACLRWVGVPASDADDDQGSSAALQEGSDGAGTKSASRKLGRDTLTRPFPDAGFGGGGRRCSVYGF